MPPQAGNVSFTSVHSVFANMDWKSDSREAMKAPTLSV